MIVTGAYAVPNFPYDRCEVYRIGFKGDRNILCDEQLIGYRRMFDTVLLSHSDSDHFRTGDLWAP